MYRPTNQGRSSYNSLWDRTWQIVCGCSAVGRVHSMTNWCLSTRRQTMSALMLPWERLPTVPTRALHLLCRLPARPRPRHTMNKPVMQTWKLVWPLQLYMNHSSATTCPSDTSGLTTATQSHSVSTLPALLLIYCVSKRGHFIFGNNFAKY